LYVVWTGSERGESDRENTNWCPIRAVDKHQEMPIAAVNKDERHALLATATAVGPSTGYMADHRGDWERLIEFSVGVSSDAIELSALAGSELPGLLAYLDRTVHLDFGYVSVHAPSKDLERGQVELASYLANLPPYVRGIVVHPDIIEETVAFHALGDRLLLENMDALKADARTVAELGRFFSALPDARFCFDIAHAFMCDRTMKLAHALLDAFGERLCEVHLSSIESDGVHVPLTVQDARRYRSVLRRCMNVPWILEAAPPEGWFAESAGV